MPGLKILVPWLTVKYTCCKKFGYMVLTFMVFQKLSCMSSFFKLILCGTCAYVCLCVCVCVFVSLTLRLLITSDVSRCNMNVIWLVKQILQLLCGSYRAAAWIGYYQLFPDIIRYFPYSFKIDKLPGGKNVWK